MKATHGLAQSLIALLGQPDVTHVAVAFDTVIRSFRNDMFDGYKTGDGVEPALLAQFPLAEEITAALGIIVWPMDEFEADDAIAAAAARYAVFAEVERVLMCSPDKDLAQMVSGDRVVMLDRRKGEVMDEAGVAVKFGVPPAAIPDYLGLVGDAADGIPGIPRWGARSAGTVLTRYGSISNIPHDAAQWDVKVRAPRVWRSRWRTSGKMRCCTASWRRCVSMFRCRQRRLMIYDGWAHVSRSLPSCADPGAGIVAEPVTRAGQGLALPAVSRERSARNRVFRFEIGLLLGVSGQALQLSRALFSGGRPGSLRFSKQPARRLAVALHGLSFQTTHPVGVAR